MHFMKSPIGFITATMFLNFAGLTIIIPVIPYILQEYTHHVALYVALITSVASLCSFLAAPVLGYVSDRVGHRPVILLSLLGGVVGYILFGIGGALWVFFLSRVIDGLSSGDTTAMYAYVADVYSGSERTKYYGILGAAAAFGFMVGPAIGGLAGTISLSMPLYVAAFISFINALWGYFVLPESLAVENRVKEIHFHNLNPLSPFRSVLKSFTLRILFLVSFIFFTGLIMQQSNFSVFLKDVFHWGPFNIGIILTLVGLVDFAAEGYFVGIFTPIFGEVRVVRIGILLTAIGMLLVGLVGFTASSTLLYVAVVIYTLGDGLFEPAMVGLIANATEPHMHGRIQGANQALQSVSRVIAPLLAGSLYEMSASAPYIVSGGIITVAFVVIVVYFRSLIFTKETPQKVNLSSL